MSGWHALLLPEVKAEAARYGRIGESLGRRLVMLILAGLAWTIPALWVPTFRWAIVVWDAMLLAAYLVDRFTLPVPGKIEVARRWSAALSLGVPCEVELTLTNRARHPLQISWSDHLPKELAAEMPCAETVVRSGFAAHIEVHRDSA